MAEIYLTLAAIGCVGVVWFFVLRPALEDWGVLRPREEEAEPVKAFTPTRQNDEPKPTPPIPVSQNIIPVLYQEDKASILRNLTERELVQLLAAKKTANKWRWSANKIYLHFGGDRNEVMNWIREIRGGEEEGDDLAVNPWSGRQTKRSYYPNNPELEYKELEA